MYSHPDLFLLVVKEHEKALIDEASRQRLAASVRRSRRGVHRRRDGGA